MGCQEKPEKEKQIVKRSGNPEVENFKREMKNITVGKPGSRELQKRNEKYKTVGKPGSRELQKRTKRLRYGWKPGDQGSRKNFQVQERMMKG